MALSTPRFQGSFGGGGIAGYREAANGTSAVSVVTPFTMVLNAQVSWATAPGNSTYMVYISDITAGTVQFKCSHADETANVDVLVIGR